MEENYNNMVYGDQEFKSFKEIFIYGLSLCKWWKKKNLKNIYMNIQMKLKKHVKLLNN